jgi:hypothetical protein
MDTRAFAEVEFITASVSHSAQVEDPDEHSFVLAPKGVASDHRHEPHEACANVEDACNRRGGVVLPCVASHPVLTGSATESAGETSLESRCRTIRCRSTVTEFL